MTLDAPEGNVNPMVAVGNGYISGAQVRRHRGRRGMG